MCSTAKFHEECVALASHKSLVRTSGYHGFILYCTLGHVGGGNSCGGHTLKRAATTQALVYPSQGARYRAEGCMALG
jgi:hypothetical protein